MEGEEGETAGFDVELHEGRTVLEITGGEVAVAVRSDSGERLYLPPDHVERVAAGADGTSSPTDRVGEGGAVPTPEGIRIVHPEPITDFRLLR